MHNLPTGKAPQKSNHPLSENYFVCVDWVTTALRHSVREWRTLQEATERRWERRFWVVKEGDGDKHSGEEGREVWNREKGEKKS